MRFKSKDFINALDMLVFAYGLAPELTAWQGFGGLAQRDGLLMLKKTPSPMVEAIWVICVSLFGDYSYSPREGWIEDADGFYEFIDDITATSRDADDLI